MQLDCLYLLGLTIFVTDSIYIIQRTGFPFSRELLVVMDLRRLSSDFVANTRARHFCFRRLGRLLGTVRRSFSLFYVMSPELVYFVLKINEK